MNINLSVPPAQTEVEGNVLEVKRMVFTGVLRWAEVWKDPLPDGVDKKLLFKDITKFICENAEARKRDDHVKMRLGEVAFPYHEANWKEIMEEDLGKSNWEGWRDGAL
ncbi:hypothetical protein PM082_023999 [Marasmius tenuissimus]|nr:hypothetical protein PM082_023999 [Marasmius tenuissimus]